MPEFGTKRGPYKTSKGEPRGSYDKEARVFKSFWKEHKMSEIEFLSDEELNKVIEAFFDRYEKRQIKVNYLWWYPDSPKDRIVDLRYNKKYN